MGELVLLENELVNIYESEENEQIVSGRELYEFLEVKTPYHKWIPRMIEYGFDENIDFMVTDIFVPNLKGGKQEQVEHYLKMDMAKEIAMIQRTDKGKMARQYFIAIEKKYREMNSQPPLTMEDLIIHNAQMLKETRLKQEEHTAKLKQLEIDSKHQNDKVIEIVDYVSKTPDFKHVEHSINTYARRSNLPHGKVWGLVYGKIEDLHGVDIKVRVNNAKKRLQAEREEKGKALYKDSTLNQKITGTAIIKELKLEKSVIEILMSLTTELDNK